MVGGRQTHSPVPVRGSICLPRSEGCANDSTQVRDQGDAPFSEAASGFCRPPSPRACSGPSGMPNGRTGRFKVRQNVLSPSHPSLRILLQPMHLLTSDGSGAGLPFSFGGVSGTGDIGCRRGAGTDPMRPVPHQAVDQFPQRRFLPLWRTWRRAPPASTEPCYATEPERQAEGWVGTATNRSRSAKIMLCCSPLLDDWARPRSTGTQNGRTV
jgi:hypothetical protein